MVATTFRYDGESFQGIYLSILFHSPRESLLMFEVNMLMPSEFIQCGWALIGSIYVIALIRKVKTDRTAEPNQWYSM